MDIVFGNLVYDKYFKGYKFSDSFSFKFIFGYVDEYLYIFLCSEDMMVIFNEFDMGFEYFIMVCLVICNILL